MKTGILLAQNTNVCNYVEDQKFHACDSDLHNVILRLEHDSVFAIEWFECNYMKLNQDKSHLLISGHNMKVYGQILVLSKFGKAVIKKFLELTLMTN